MIVVFQAEDVPRFAFAYHLVWSRIFARIHDASIEFQHASIERHSCEKRRADWVAVFVYKHDVELARIGIEREGG